jgi:hypothetical protein
MDPVDARARRMMPVCAVALGLPPHYFDPKFPPITYEQYLLWWYDANYSAAVQRDPG